MKLNSKARRARHRAWVKANRGAWGAPGHVTPAYLAEQARKNRSMRQMLASLDAVPYGGPPRVQFMHPTALPELQRLDPHSPPPLMFDRGDGEGFTDKPLEPGEFPRAMLRTGELGRWDGATKLWPRTKSA